MLIAIDHGNYAVKTPSFSFVSGLSEHTVKPPLTDEIIEYAGRILLKIQTQMLWDMKCSVIRNYIS